MAKGIDVDYIPVERKGMYPKKRYIYVMRHGEAERAMDHDDFKRSLTNRGIQGVLSQTEAFKQADGIRPDCILSSSAKRAKETVALLQKLFLGIPVFFKDGLYLAPSYRILDVIKEMDDLFERILIVGHNPGLEQIVSLMTKEQCKMEPATCVVIELDTQSWGKIKMGSGTIQKIF